MLFHTVGHRHVAYVVHMHCCSLLCATGKRWFDAYVQNYPQSVNVCVCVWLHSTVIISMSVFDGSLHTEHMDVYTYMYLVSRVCVCSDTEVYVRVKALVSVLLPFIFLSGWLNTRMPVVWACARVGERKRVRVSSPSVCFGVLALAPCVCGCEVKCLLAGPGWRAGGEQRWKRRFAEKTRTTSPITTFSSSTSLSLTASSSSSSFSPSYTSSASFLFPHLHSFCSGSSRSSFPFKTLYDPSSKSDFYRSYLKFV